MPFALLIVVLVLSVILGGGTRAGFLGDVVVQVAATFLLVTALWRRPGAEGGSRGSADADQGPSRVGQLALLALVGGALALQMMPTVSGLSKVPAPFPSEFGQLASGWWMVALVPHEALAAACSFIVPLAVFFAASQLDREQRLQLLTVLLVLGGASAALGLFQVAQGPTSPLRFFEFTNPTEAVGFFANRNHLAGLLYSVLVLAVVPLAGVVQDVAKPGRLRPETILRLCAYVALIFMVLAGIVLARSRAGLLLSMVALAGIAVLLTTGGSSEPGTERAAASRSRSWRPGRLSLVLVGGMALVATELGLQRILTRFEGDLFQDLRLTFSAETARAAYNAMPFGTGLGSFVSVYGIIEKPEDAFAAYVNRAHNDLAEIVLETGAVGLALLLLFLLWFLFRSGAAWLGSGSAQRSGVAHRRLQRASTLVVLLLLLHSLVDYPLRTAALAAVFAYCCAMLVPPLRRADATARADDGDHRIAPRPPELPASHGAQLPPPMLPPLAGNVPAPEATALPAPPHSVQAGSGRAPPARTGPGAPDLGVAWPSEWRPGPRPTRPGMRQNDDDAG